jgi:hypothetical protein
MKNFTEQQLKDKFEKLSKPVKIQILWDALDIMQQFNGRTKLVCVFFAMGYDTQDYNNWFKQYS